MTEGKHTAGREAILRQAIINAAYAKCGWTGWRLRRWLGSQSITNGGRKICGPLLIETYSAFRELASRAAIKKAGG